MVTLQSKGICLEFDADRGVISSLKDGFREFVGQEMPVFQVALRDADGEQQLADVSEMTLADLKRDDAEFTAVYEGCGLRVTVTCAALGGLSWSLSADVQDDRTLEWVDFPRIAVPNDLRGNGGNGKILSGICEGLLVDDLSYRESFFMKYLEPEYPVVSSVPLYPGIAQTPILAYYNDISGLYLGVHEMEDSMKFLSFRALETGIFLQLRHYCGTNPGESYVLCGAAVMEAFRGDWYDAAAIYKMWLRENKGDKFLPISENPNLPDWYGESPIIVPNHVWKYTEKTKLFPYMNALPYAKRLSEALESKIMMLLMHWEGTVPWAPPYAWPPKGGEVLLKEYIDALHADGNLIGLYGSGIGWTQYHRYCDYNREAEFGEKDLRKYMCLSPKQELPYCNVVPEIRAGYNLCPTGSFVTEVMTDQVQQMAAADVDYIQLMDQNNGGESFFCYGKDHGHPPVPGKWEVDAMKRFYEAVNAKAGKALLGAECAAAEPYLSYLRLNDDRFVYNYAAGVPVPLYAFLYHPYINNFLGNQCTAIAIIDTEKSPGAELERLGYAFAAGDFLSVVMNEDGNVTWECSCNFDEACPPQEPILTLTANANRWRRGMGKKYLHTGDMVKPFPVQCGRKTLYSTWGMPIRLPKIHTSAWQASDGSRGQFLMNYNPEEETCVVLLPEGNYRIYEDETHFCDVCGGRLELTIKRLSAVLIETRDE